MKKRKEGERGEECEKGRRGWDGGKEKGEEGGEGEEIGWQKTESDGISEHWSLQLVDYRVK